MQKYQPLAKFLRYKMNFELALAYSCYLLVKLPNPFYPFNGTIRNQFVESQIDHGWPPEQFDARIKRKMGEVLL